MFCPPLLKTQLNDGTVTASKDCAVCSLIMLFDAATCGLYVPTVHEVRAACDNPFGGLSVEDYQQAVTAILPRAQTRVGHSIEAHYYIRPTPIASLRDDLKAGFGCALAVDYSLIPDQYSGQPTYNDFHALFLRGWRYIDGERLVRDFDPLFDGRHPKTPDAPMLVPFWPVIAVAAAGFTGTPDTFAGVTMKQGVKH